MLQDITTWPSRSCWWWVRSWATRLLSGSPSLTSRSSWRPPWSRQSACSSTSIPSLGDVSFSVADLGCLSRIPGPNYSIPDPNFFPSRIRIKEFKYFNPNKSGFQDPGVKNAPDPGSGSATLVSLCTVILNRFGGILSNKKAVLPMSANATRIRFIRA